MPRRGKGADRARVIVVDDHPSMLAYIGRVLRQEFEVVDLVPDAESLLARWPVVQPDAIVLDVSLPGRSGFEAAARVRAGGCCAPIVFCSVHEGQEYVRAAWTAGGLGYVAKRDLGLELVPAVRAALRGRRFVSAAIGSR